MKVTNTIDHTHVTLSTKDARALVNAILAALCNQLNYRTGESDGECAGVSVELTD